MDYLDNPAGILKRWITAFDRHPNRQEALSVVICQMRGLDHETLAGRVEATRQGVALVELCHEVRVEAAFLPDFVEPEPLLDDFAQVERAFDYFTLARQTNVDQMLQNINAAGHLSVDWLSRQLHRYRSQFHLDERVRESLLKKVRALRKDVYDDESLDQDLKDFLLRRFADIEDALEGADVTGSAPVETAIDSIIGSIHRQPGMWQRVAESTVASTVSGVVVALLLSLLVPPDKNALPPGTPQPMVDAYVVVQSDPPPNGITVEIIEGVVVSSRYEQVGPPTPQFEDQEH